MKLKLILWKLGIINKCPYCNRKLKPVGHEQDFGEQHYECYKQDCKFNTPKKMQGYN